MAVPYRESYAYLGTAGEWMEADEYVLGAQAISAVRCVACGGKVIDTDRGRLTHATIACPILDYDEDPDDVDRWESTTSFWRPVETVELPRGDVI